MGCFSYPTPRECWLEELTYCVKKHERREKNGVGRPKVKINNLCESEPQTLCPKGMREEPSFHPLNAAMRAIVDRKRKIFSSSSSPEKSMIKQKHNGATANPRIFIRKQR